MTPTARQTEQQQQLAKASSVTSLALKPKGKAAKGPKGKAAAAKGRKGDALKKSERVIWDSQKRRAVEGVPAAGRQFANASRLHQVALLDMSPSSHASSCTCLLGNLWTHLGCIR